LVEALCLFILNPIFMRRIFLIIPFLTIVFFFACKNKNSQVVLPAEPDREVAKDNLVIKRYEEALFALDKTRLKQGLASINPEFSIFLGNNWQDTMNILRVYNFLSDPNIRELFNLTEKKYPDVSSLEDRLGKALNIFRQSYPERPMPKVYTYVSGLDIENPVLYFDTAMVIGLDLFLGSGLPAYQKAGIPKYKSAQFTPDNLLPQCMLAVSDHIIRVDDKSNTLLDMMVQAGKAMYFLDVTLPDVPDENKIGYATAQLAWSLENESNVWAFIIENQLLFSSDPKGIAKLITDAPFTAGFDTQSPGRLGVYLGWQIVRKYMKEASTTTLRQLMEEIDAQKILRVSGFKPGGRKS